MQLIDAILNRYTMYRVVLYGLAVLLLVGDALAFTGTLAIAPVGLLATIAILIASCYVANRFFAWLFRAPYNTESWLISALILACILPPAQTVGHAGLVVLCAVIAMASKYIVVFRGSHFLNPVAVAAFVMSVSGLLPATWWVATPPLAPIAVLVGLVVLRKQRKFSMFATFAAAALLTMLYIGALQGQSSVGVVRNAFLSWPIIFMGSIMLTEPGTLPPFRYYQLLFGVLVGVVFASELRVGVVSATPQTALLLGNLFTLVTVPAAGAMLRLKQITTLGPHLYDLAFERPKHINFIAGQYMEWTLPHEHTDSRGNRRMFSLASSPTEPDLHIGIKTYQPSSSFKRALLHLKPGAYVRAAHAAGSFILPADADKPLVFIAGGIGITPFRSMLRYLVDTKQRRNITLLYAVSKVEDFAYESDLQLAESIGLQWQRIVGTIAAANLTPLVPAAKRGIVYVSGPDAFVSHCKHLLVGLGVPHTNIRTDHFTGY